METIRGKRSLELDCIGWKEQLIKYERIVIDLGTGDGRYARTLAEKHPGWFIIGMDACRENLREHSQTKLPNLLFVIASAQNLPPALQGLVSHITINFPWGSLLGSLLAGDLRLLRGLESLSGTALSLELRLNAGALKEAGTTLETGVKMICQNLHHAGWQVTPPEVMDARDLGGFPSTWAKRLAFGRDPRAVKLSARK
jgi:16S rRNA (adenine(1408)-N(1))-methyltransferase